MLTTGMRQERDDVAGGLRLYHGTVAAVAEVAKAEGLKPRGETGGRGNWPACPSRPDCVYLTSVLGGTFAVRAARSALDVPAVVEIDARFLDPVCLLPDEDFVEQVSRPKRNRGQMLKRTAEIRSRLEEFAGAWEINGEPLRGWEASLTGLGTCAYRGRSRRRRSPGSCTCGTATIP